MTYKKDEGKIPDWIEELVGVGLIVIIIGAIVFTAIFFLTMFVNVDVGHAVILKDPWAGTIGNPIIGPTWVTKAPWVASTDIYYATTSTEMWTDNEAGTTGEYPAIHVLSKDGLDIEVDILIRYSLDPLQLRELYKSFPDKRWEDRVISSVVREDVRDVIAQYLALEIIEEREILSAKMRETIFNSLTHEPSLHTALLESSIEIDLRDIDPPLKFKEAIEAKLTAEQQKIQAEFERSRIIVLADAEAQKLITEAYGQAQAEITVANGTAQAIQLIQEQVGAEGWETYYSLQMLNKMSPNVGVLIVNTSEGENPLIYALPEG